MNDSLHRQSQHEYPTLSATDVELQLELQVSNGAGAARRGEVVNLNDRGVVAHDFPENRLLYSQLAKR